MESSDPAHSRVAQFRAALRLQSARQALDVLLEHASGLSGYRLEPAADQTVNELHYIDEQSRQRAFTLGVEDGELLFGVHAPGFNLVPGGLPSLEAGLGPVSELDDGTWRLALSRSVQAHALTRLLFGQEEVRGMTVRHWRVNLPDAQAGEIDGGYVWTAKLPSGRSVRSLRVPITRIVSGDVLFAHAGGAIIAIAVALDRARSAPDPRLTGSDGWLLPVRFARLDEPLKAKDEARRHRTNGKTNTVPYLSEVAESRGHEQRRLLGRQVENLEDRMAAESDGKLLEQAIEEHIWQRTDITPADKRQLCFARIGHGMFRERVEHIETACRVTGILDRRYLRATHIKPWKDASDEERLDGANGLLLSPHVLHLFDRGHVSFADDGTLLISRHLNPYVQKAWNLEHPVAPRAFRPSQRPYLEYHRTHVFERVSGGRRSAEETVE